MWNIEEIDRGIASFFHTFDVTVNSCAKTDIGALEQFLFVCYNFVDMDHFEKKADIHIWLLLFYLCVKAETCLHSTTCHSVLWPGLDGFW